MADRAELDELRRLEELEAKSHGGYRAEAAVGPTPTPTGSPANAGFAKLATQVVGAPVDAVESAINIPPQLVKTGLMAAGRYDLANRIPMLQGSFGGSQFLQNALRKSGIAGLNPDNPAPGDPMATLQYDMMARGGAIPGGALPAAASIVAERNLGPDYAGVGSMAPTAAITGYNAVRAPTLQGQRTHQAVRDETWKNAQEAGYVAPPSHVNPTFVGNRAEGIAGKAAINQEAVDRNAIVTDNLARRASGIAAGERITPDNLERVRSNLAAPYREVTAVSPLAANALQKLRDTRKEAQLEWAHYERQQVPQAQRNAQALDQKADMLERVIEREALKAGKPDLLPRLREARVAIARNYDVERALNTADGHIDPQVLVAAMNRGAPLSGDLKMIADFTKAFPHASRAPSKNPTPGVSALESNAAAGFGMAGQATGMGLLPMGVPLVGAPVRGALLSRPYQSTFAQPNYDPMLSPESTLQSLYRAAILQNEANK